MTDKMLERVALIADLVSRAPRRLGRTALMKCLFFLKVLKGVPLPYHFRLHTYGPYDSDVLYDLQYAEYLGAVESALVAYPGGQDTNTSAGRKPKACRARRRSSWRSTGTASTGC
jgi:hypothetical protein